jgi:dTDP-4-dehydrorhamnose reductase
MKIIIFGSNGMLGTYLNKFLSEIYDVVSITRKDIDLSKASENEVLNFLSNRVSEKDLIINASGIIKQREYDINDMIKVNSVFPNILSKFKKNTNCNIIHISTDCVYSGHKGNYLENDSHDCLDEYGKTKSLGENKNLTIIRTSIIGEELHNKKSLIEWAKSQSNKTINGYTNHLWNGVTCLELSKLIDKIIKTKNFWIGIKHIFSPKTVSKYELLNIINEIYGLNITINKTETLEKCYRNLNSLYICPIELDLYQQIVEMKKFRNKI